MEVTFLREEETWGDNALEVIKAYGTRVGISDAAIALGTHMNRNSDDKDITGVASGHSWLTSFHISGDVHIVYYYGTEHCIYPSGREAAGRPAIPASVTSAIRPKNVREEHLANGKTVQICEYGEYPKTVAPKPVSQELETLYRKKTLKPPAEPILLIRQNLEPTIPDLSRETVRSTGITAKNMSVLKANPLTTILSCPTAHRFRKVRRIGSKSSR